MVQMLPYTATAASGSASKQKIQQSTNGTINGNIREMQEKTNTATSGSKDAPLQQRLQQRQMQANPKVGNGDEANSANSKNEQGTRTQQAANVEISKKEEAKIRQQAKSTISASMKRQLRQQHWQARRECSNAIKRRRHIKCNKQKMNAETGGGKKGQYPRTRNLKLSRNRSKQLSQRQMVSECSNQERNKKGENRQRTNVKNQEAITIRMAQAATRSSKNAVQPAKVSKNSRGHPTKAIKQITASTTMSTVQMRRSARLSPSPDGKMANGIAALTAVIPASLCRAGSQRRQFLQWTGG